MCDGDFCGSRVWDALLCPVINYDSKSSKRFSCERKQRGECFVTKIIRSINFDHLSFAARHSRLFVMNGTRTTPNCHLSRARGHRLANNSPHHTFLFSRQLRRFFICWTKTPINFNFATRPLVLPC